ncbi:MAG: DUF4440 domain-containing protein, partial [Actinomycetota bacterium]|nr:DUF4440 domain-containing protein [Actinomycetota bacterium]
MTTSFELTDDATKHTEVYVKAFNTNDPDALDLLYTEEAVVVWEPGQPLSGEARRESAREFLARKPTMTATDRQRFITGDTALLIVDWSIDMTGVDGEPEHLVGVGVDVLRKG